MACQPAGPLRCPGAAMGLLTRLQTRPGLVCATVLCSESLLPAFTLREDRSHRVVFRVLAPILHRHPGSIPLFLHLFSALCTFGEVSLAPLKRVTPRGCVASWEGLVPLWLLQLALLALLFNPKGHLKWAPQVPPHGRLPHRKKLCFLCWGVLPLCILHAGQERQDSAWCTKVLEGGRLCAS